MATETQTVAGAGQFTGAALAGLFSFSTFDSLPRTTRVVVTIVGYHAAAGGIPGTLFELSFVRVGGLATERILLARADAAEIIGPATDGDVTVCGRVVPRDQDGAHWNLVATTAGKDVTATVTVDTVLNPFRDDTL